MFFTFPQNLENTFILFFIFWQKLKHPLVHLHIQVGFFFRLRLYSELTLFLNIRNLASLDITIKKGTEDWRWRDGEIKKTNCLYPWVSKQSMVKLLKSRVLVKQETSRKMQEIVFINAAQMQTAFICQVIENSCWILRAFR